MDTTIHITMGFKIDNVFFGWKDGVLYQLPYEHCGRYFALRKLRKKVSKSGWEYYHLRRKKVGIEKLRAMLQGVEWEVRSPYELK